MGKKLFFFNLIIFVFFYQGSILAQGCEKGKWKISGYFKSASGWRISEGNDNDLLKCETILQLEPEYHLDENISFYGIFRAYYDAVFDLEKSGWTDDFRHKGEIKSNNVNTVSDPIREFYGEIRWGKFFMRLGKQQIGWGKAIGMKMLDVINPQDMRELNQLDFEESRIPLWTANFIYSTPLRGSSIQLVLIPDIEPHFFPPAGYPFSDQSIDSMQQLIDMGLIHLRRGPTVGERVEQNLKNMEIGVKWYQNLVDFEYSLNYFYHWSDIPGLYFNSFGTGGIPNYNMKYHRFHTLGGSFTNYLLMCNKNPKKS